MGVISFVLVRVSCIFGAFVTFVFSLLCYGLPSLLRFAFSFCIFYDLCEAKMSTMVLSRVYVGAYSILAIDTDIVVCPI